MMMMMMIVSQMRLGFARLHFGILALNTSFAKKIYYLSDDFPLVDTNNNKKFRKLINPHI